ncbi:uncharacterized protein LOC134242973 [Saccostrea cucullata]|uniref:uncharacterized protein LOC134242973 n=1 Tax=Saccostrea cuccullata TaxID=36930 RepID=UPI002ED354C0
MFAVFHPKKPESIRVVFDSSAKYQDVSLNSVLLQGPDLLNSLVGILLRFCMEKRELLVDDGLVSCKTVEHTVDLVLRTKQALHDNGRIRLHRFASNSREVLNGLDQGDLAKDLKDLDLGTATLPTQRCLGLLWNTDTDTFTFKVSSVERSYIRRGLLSVINSVFDPIGFLQPFIIEGKLLLREMMSVTSKTDWDDALPEPLCNKWISLMNSLSYLETLHMPRMYGDISFEDATHREFLIGKAKLAPTQGHTIPRLELCAAVLATEIAENVRDQLKIPQNNFHFFTDSQVVLGYISNETRRFYIYVANRVGRIRLFSQPSQWHHVRTECNPADVATSSIDASQLEDSAWLRGQVETPEITTKSEFELVNPEHDIEVRPEVTSCKQEEDTEDCPKTSNRFSDHFSRFSSWNRLRQLYGRNEVHERVRQNSTQQYHPISLSPVLDSEGVLRVSGRLNKVNDAELSGQQRNPIILPKNHHVSHLLIGHFHSEVFHQGLHFTEGAVRAAGYWIVGLKRKVSSFISKCVMCRKLWGKFSQQKMADLPEDRCKPSPPFSYVGVDTFGPWMVAFRRTKGGSANQKRWGLLFTCLVTRAIHIEIIEQLTKFIEKGPVQDFLSNCRTTWKFNPPHAPHMGGVWERLIGTVKRILNSMLLQRQGRDLTNEELTTLMTEICAIVNNRPLIDVTCDLDSSNLLMPSMLLTMKTYPDVGPFPPLGTKDALKSAWKNVQVLAEEFWRRWKSEYLHHLHKREKRTELRNIKSGDVILLKDESPCNEWPMGVVRRTFESGDGLVRKVEKAIVKDGKQVLCLRPITDLILLLEVDE